MYWREDGPQDPPAPLPDDIFDLLFRVEGDSLEIDHAWALARALREHCDDDTVERLGILGVRMAESGNGWLRPEAADAALPLSRRSRLAIRLHRDDAERLRALSRKTLRIGGSSVVLGAVSERPLSSLDTLYARAVVCDEHEDESRLLERVAAELADMDIEVSRMLCGRAGRIRTADAVLHSRALMVADLTPAQSVRLQRRGIGSDRLLGCGLFVGHKGIDAVYEKSE